MVKTKEYIKFEKAFKELDYVRNNECWPLVSFDGKDADLEPSGCCGIKRITKIGKGKIDIDVGGHKTIGDPTFESEFDLSVDDIAMYSEIAFELVSGCGYLGNWTGDDWCLHMEQKQISIPIIFHANGNIHYEKTAKNAIKIAKDAVEEFQNEMAYVDIQIDNIYKEIRNKYQQEEEI